MSELVIRQVPLSELTPDPQNVRTHDGKNLSSIAHSLNAFGQRKPIVCARANDGSLVVIAGNGTLEAAQSLGWTHLAVAEVPADWDADKARAYAIADNRSAELADWNQVALESALMELEAVGWDPEVMGFDAAELNPPADSLEPSRSLRDRFLVPPFSILDSTHGDWQARKRTWLDLGIQSELGRDTGLTYTAAAAYVNWYDVKKEADRVAGRKLTNEEFMKTEQAKGLKHIGGGTSVFDPVLCEIAVRWFSPEGGQVLDVFAGGSVRGVVAGMLGRDYTGVELRAEQVEANREQWAELSTAVVELPDRDTQMGDVVWHTGDSTKLPELLPDGYEADLLFSCPPYADLEVYSDDPADLSNMPYPEFLAAYEDIIAKAVARLKPNSFAVWVVGEVRSKKNGGAYVGFVPDTIKAFEKAGAKFYNEGILLNAVGSIRVTAGRFFTTTRKLAKRHQNVLVFVKGDPKLATEKCGEVDVAEALAEALVSEDD